MALYIKSDKGFGNKIYDLISAAYLKQRYKVPVYMVMNDKNFPIVMDKSRSLVSYITFEEYPKPPPKAMYIKSFDALPKDITEPTTIMNVCAFIPFFHHELSDTTIAKLQVNPNSVTKDLHKLKKQTYGCVNIRYDKNLCSAINTEIKSNIPVFHPDYYKDQIQALLARETMDAVYIITESIELVNQYVLKDIDDPRIIIADYNPVDLFFIMTNASYLVLSHNYFGFAAAYLNQKGTIYLLIPGAEKPEDDSPWQLITDPKYLITADMAITKDMAYAFGDCDKYVSKVNRMAKGSRSRIYPRVYFDTNPATMGKTERSSVIHYGNLHVNNLIVHRSLTVEGGLRFYNLLVRGMTRIQGNTYGIKGTISDLTVIGEAHLESSILGNCLVNGSLVSQNCLFKYDTVLIGNCFINHCTLDRVQLLSKRTDIANSNIHDLVIMHNDPLLIRLINCNVARILSDNPVTVYISSNTKIKVSHNVNLLLDSSI